MFSTFTGNARRPRNVNLSGAVGNPFSNTTWTPSAASNPTKAVTDAQAEREKRQADRQRLKAAGQIQRIWRGHKERRKLSDARRTLFDSLYASHGTDGHLSTERLPLAFNLLLAFFDPARNDDIPRLFNFVRDCGTTQIKDIPPAKAHQSRMTRFAQILASGTEAAAHGAQNSDDQVRQNVFELLKLAERVIVAHPQILAACVHKYFAALSVVFTYGGMNDGRISSLSDALSAPFKASSGTGKHHR